MASLKTLYLVRHTRPQVVPGLCYGQLDLPLSESFPDEAAYVAACLPAVELIVSSPLKRCLQLAELLAAQQGCTLLSDARLQEMHFGDWEGLHWDDIPREQLSAWSTSLLDYQPPQGESAQQLQHRVDQCLHEFLGMPQSAIAVVAHGGSLRAMLAQLSRRPLSEVLQWQIDYGAVIGVRVAV